MARLLMRMVHVTSASIVFASISAASVSSANKVSPKFDSKCCDPHSLPVEFTPHQRRDILMSGFAIASAASWRTTRPLPCQRDSMKWLGDFRRSVQLQTLSCRCQVVDFSNNGCFLTDRRNSGLVSPFRTHQGEVFIRWGGEFERVRFGARVGLLETVASAAFVPNTFCVGVGGFVRRRRTRTELETQRGSARNAESEIEELLRSKLRMSAGEVQDVAAALGRSRGVDIATEVVSFFCGGGLDLSMTEMRKLVLQEPCILELSVEENLAPQAVSWLRRADLGLTRQQLGEMVIACPAVISSDYDTSLAPIVLWLLADVKLPRDKVAKALVSCPTLLTADLDHDLKARYRWMVEDLGLDEKNARRVFTLAPQVLTASFEEVVLPACQWLMSVTGCDKTGVGRALTKSPAVLLSSPSNLDERFLAMSSRLFDGDRDPAAKALLAQPLLLLQSDRLGPLIEVVVGQLGVTLSEAAEEMVSDPSILEFQVTRRLLPRLQAIKDAGMGTAQLNRTGDSDVRFREDGSLSLKEKLKVLGKFSDARFAKWLGRTSVRTSPRNDIAFFKTR